MNKVGKYIVKNKEGEYWKTDVQSEESLRMGVGWRELTTTTITNTMKIRPDEVAGYEEQGYEVQEQNPKEDS
jgi:hypothetical protein